MVTVVATLLVTRDGGYALSPPPDADSDQTTTGIAPNNAVSVGIITNEPTCSAWGPINDALAAAQENGWQLRDPALPASAWTAAQRQQHRQVADAMRGAADQTEHLASATKNTVVRDIYQQFIAYAREYADKVPLYQPPDDHLARVTVGTSLALTSICAAIKTGAASSSAPFVEPSTLPNRGDGAAPFLEQPAPVCPRWEEHVLRYSMDTSAWRQIDPNLAAQQWSPEQKSINEAVVPLMLASADRIEDLAEESQNIVIERFGALATEYQRAFAATLPNYVPENNYLNEVVTGLIGSVSDACRAVDGS
ncbi:hypothetical protein [Mycolicibacterium aurum]|uniref:hypothetical protein n=1 Tax=Mycolicibacterium aurum TaxID=1791 RepID=UPI000F83A5EA|nr:hypothetical protein [Mycolicibacterium aurum]